MSGPALTPEREWIVSRKRRKRASTAVGVERLRGADGVEKERERGGNLYIYIYVQREREREREKQRKRERVIVCQG